MVHGAEVVVPIKVVAGLLNKLAIMNKGMLHLLNKWKMLSTLSS